MNAGRGAVGAWVFGGAALAACSSRQAPPTAPVQPAPVSVGPAASETPAAPGTPTAPVAEDSAPAAAPIAEARVRELLRAWTEAQNSGAFDAYEALYARQFLGIRRTGPRTRRFDRPRWLDDRRAMFAHPMTVRADDVRVTTTPQVAVVTFAQTFESGGFRDAGPKQLVVVDEGGALRIAREEMLASRVDPAGPAPAALRPGDFMFVVQADGPRVVLTGDVGAGWSSGAPALRSRAEPAAAEAPAGRGLPAEWAQWRGRELQVYGPAGVVCAARVGDLGVLRRVVVHFGTHMRWDGVDPGTNRHTLHRASDREVAAEAWSQGAGSDVLVGALTPAAGQDCAGALWARDAGRPAAPVFVASTPPEPERASFVARFHALGPWGALQHEYATSEGAGHGPWDESNGSHITLHRWQRAGGARAFVTLSAFASTGCAGFTGELWSVFEAAPAGAVLRTSATAPGDFVPTAAFDLDGDDVPEFLAGEQLLRPVGGVYRRVEHLPAVPDFDCGC